MGKKVVETQRKRLSLSSIISKESAGAKLTTSERRTLMEFRRRNPAWSKVYECSVSAGSVKAKLTLDPSQELQVWHAPSRMAFELRKHED